MRLERVESLLRLALLMQAQSDGVGLQEIQEQFDVGRRTAERMRDAIARLFPHLEESRSHDGTKRWALPNGSLAGLVHFNADELAQLQSSIEHLTQANMQPQAELLQAVTHKLHGMMRPDAKRRNAPDIEALLEAEGYACRVGPRPQMKAEILAILRESIKGCCKVRIHYQARHHGKQSERVVSPYGFIYGSRHYLLAFCDNAKDLRTFSLPNIQSAALTAESYSIPEDFSLQKHIEQRFGVFSEEPMEVVLRFSPQVADDVVEHLFHPSQSIEPLEDGRMEVRFTAGGWREICWHLFTWEGHVEILSPSSLKERFQHMVATLAEGEAIPRFSDPLMDDERFEQVELYF